MVFQVIKENIEHVPMIQRVVIWDSPERFNFTTKIYQLFIGHEIFGMENGKYREEAWKIFD